MDLLINLLILSVALGLIYWIVTILPLQPPFNIVARVVFAIIALVLLLGAIGAVPTLHFYHYRP